ncbi:hypothetical protein Dimus_028328 [Dionaea muscipula]
MSNVQGRKISHILLASFFLFFFLGNIMLASYTPINVPALSRDSVSILISIHRNMSFLGSRGMGGGGGGMSGGGMFRAATRVSRAGVNGLQIDDDRATSNSSDTDRPPPSPTSPTNNRGISASPTSSASTPPPHPCSDPRACHFPGVRWLAVAESVFH